MNAEQVGEVVRAEVSKALATQKLEFDRKIIAIQSQISLAKPKVEKFTKVTINSLVGCEITLDAVKSLPEFFGHPGTYVSWREAAHNAYELFRRYDGSERHYQVVTIIRNKVRGAADAVLSSFNTVLNFNAIIARLDFTYADKRPIYLIEQELSKLRQGAMSCLEFYDEVEKKVTLLAKKTIIRVFISGLRKPLCDILFASRPSDLPSALALAQEVDANKVRYDFATSFANRFSENSHDIRGSLAQGPNRKKYNSEPYSGHKNPHYSISKQNMQGSINNQRPYNNFGQGRVEPMEVDPSVSRFRHQSNGGRDHNNREQRNLQKRVANSGRYTGPKMQRVNHLNEEPDSSVGATYDGEAEQAAEVIEYDELNFLGQSLSRLGFQGH